MKSFLRDESGLTLTEILITLTLIGIIFGVANFSGIGRRDILREGIDNFERTIRYASSEAILHGGLVRIHFDLDKSPQEYTIEHGPKGEFVLPSSKGSESELVQSLADKEKMQTLQKKLDQNFEPIAEFKDAAAPLPSNLRIVGIGNSLKKNLTVNGAPAIYFYPSGERDLSLVILGTDHEVGAIKIAPFKDGVDESIKGIDTNGLSDEEILNLQDKEAKEFFTQWLRE